MRIFQWQQGDDRRHVQYIGYIVTLAIYWVLGNTIQYSSMSYGVIQYAPLDNTIILRRAPYCQYHIVYIISNTASDLKKYLEIRLHETSHRTYLWVYLVFNFLEKEDFKRTLKGVDATIKTLPKSINEAYEQILNKSKEDPMVRKVLNIMLAATRPLTLSEMNIAVNIDETLQSILDIDLEDEDDFKTRLRSWCGLFITIHQGKLYFLHQTGREFLLADLMSTIHAPSELRWRYSFTSHGAQVVLATICVLYLNILKSVFRPPKIKSANGGKRDGNDLVAFFEYTAKNWGFHFREADVPDSEGISLYAWNICDPESRIFAIWFKVYCGSLDKAPAGWTRLMLSSYLGFGAFVKHALTEGVDIEARDAKYSRTSLSWAAYEGHEAIVKFLLGSGASIDTTDGLSRTPLLLAAENGQEAVVRLLLEKGAYMEAADRHGRTPLSLAAENGQVAVVTLLLDKGAGIDAADRHGRTPLSLAAENGQDTIVELLLKSEGVDENSLSSAPFDSGRSPLSYAAQNGHEEVVDILLSRRSIAVDSEDNSGKTPSTYAVAAAYSRIARALVNRGAKVPRTDFDRKGMLHHAINADSELDEVEFLIRLGAPTKSEDIDNMTPLHYTVRFARTDIAELLLRHNVPVNTAVHRRLWTRDFEAGNSIWKPEAEESAVSSEPKSGLTALHCAALVGQDKMVSFFLRNKANVNALSDYGETALHLALATTVEGTRYEDYWISDDWKVEAVLDIIDVTDNEEFGKAQRDILHRRMAVLDVLLNHPNIDITVRDHKGETALHKVRYGNFGSSRLVERLLQMNAEATSRYRDNRTPLHLACAKQDVQSVSLLAPRSQLALSDTEGQNALHFACASACLETMTEVIRACETQGVDLSSTRDNRGRNALHCYVKAINVDVEGVQRLLDYGVATGETDVNGSHPISVYLDRWLGSVEQDICRLLLVGVDPKHVNSRGLTFAHIYARQQVVTVPILKCLKEIGVPLSAIDAQGRHLLHHLALHGSLTSEVLDFVISNTSMVLEAKDDAGKTPRQYAEEKANSATPGSFSYDGAMITLKTFLEVV